MRSLAILAPALVVCSTLAAQSQRFVVQPTTSLAWWQIDPHYEHLWATTCPADPSWQPGEGRDPGLYTDYSTRPNTVPAAHRETRIPLFPRYRVRPVCRQAVHGTLTVDDTARLDGVRGLIVVNPDSLFTGLEIRDAYARKAILETARYPEIRFRIDSVVDVVRDDSVRAIAVGVFESHGGAIPVRAPLVALRDPAGLRVRAQFAVPARALIDDLGMSTWALGMGVAMKRWKVLYMGVDVILRHGISEAP
jgi:hypothetical protein